MKIGNLLATATLSIVSFSSFAVEVLHPVTQDLIFDTDSFQFIGECGDSVATYNAANSTVDITYLNMYAQGKGNDDANTNCQFSFNIQVPGGWIVVLDTQAGISGQSVGRGIVSFLHTVGGGNRPGAFKYLTDPGTFSLDQAYQRIGVAECGQDLPLKNVAQIVSLDDDSYVTLSAGNIDGASVKYYIDWEKC